jgi:hypothetical protein
MTPVLMYVLTLVRLLPTLSAKIYEYINIYFNNIRMAVNYRSHKFPPPVHILNQLDPIYAPNSHSLKQVSKNTCKYVVWFLSLIMSNKPRKRTADNISMKWICPAHYNSFFSFYVDFVLNNPRISPLISQNLSDS